MSDSIFGERLKLSLRYCGKMQKELAKELGVTNNTISYWCSGSRTPNTKQVIQIAKYLGVSADYLLGLSDYPSAREQTTVDAAVKELNRIREKFLVPYTAIEELLRFIGGTSKCELE